MGESFPDDYPISEFPSEGDASVFPSEKSRPSAGPHSPAPVAGGLRRDTTLLEVVPVAVMDRTPPHAGGAGGAGGNVRRRRRTAVAAVKRWLVGTSTRRGGALLPLIARGVAVLWTSLPAITTNRTSRPTVSMPLVAFLSGVTLGALAMWMMPARMEGGAALVESTGVKAAPERQRIALAGIGEAPRSTATSGSQSPNTSATSPARAGMVAPSAALPRTAPLPDEATPRALEPAVQAVRRPPQKPSPARRQTAATRSPAATGTQYRGALAVRSRPAGASVFINGRLVGTTPLVLTSEPVGSRAVRMTLSGHEAWTAAARVVADRETAINADLRSLITQ